MMTGVVLAILTLIYLTQTDAYLTEVTPLLTPGQQRASAKAATKRPELREDVAHWILLDPQRAVEYGQPQGTTRPGGTHARPRGHGRRGHWRELRAARFGERRGQRIWVRPAWIGDDEWTAEGQRYRVRPPSD